MEGSFVVFWHTENNFKWDLSVVTVSNSPILTSLKYGLPCDEGPAVMLGCRGIPTRQGLLYCQDQLYVQETQAPFPLSSPLSPNLLDRVANKLLYNNTVLLNLVVQAGVPSKTWLLRWTELYNQSCWESTQHKVCHLQQIQTLLILVKGCFAVNKWRKSCWHAVM